MSGRRVVWMACWLVAAFCLGAGTVHAQLPPNGTITCGTPKGSATNANPLLFRVWEWNGVQWVPRNVKIKNLPAKGAGETEAQAQARKASTIASALNKVLGPGRAVAAGNVVTVTNFGGARLLAPDPTLQPGNGVRLIPGGGGQPPTPGHGSYGGSSMSSSATGMDPDGLSSTVEFGISEIYVATVLPSPGDTTEDVMLALEAQLDANGLPTSYNPTTLNLTFDSMIAAGDQMVWGSTDTGLQLVMNFKSTTIPEPGTLVLLAAMGLSGMMFRRRGK